MKETDNWKKSGKQGKRHATRGRLHSSQVPVIAFCLETFNRGSMLFSLFDLWCQKWTLITWQYFKLVCWAKFNSPVALLLVWHGPAWQAWSYNSITDLYGGNPCLPVSLLTFNPLGVVSLHWNSYQSSPSIAEESSSSLWELLQMIPALSGNQLAEQGWWPLWSVYHPYHCYAILLGFQEFTMNKSVEKN